MSRHRKTGRVIAFDGPDGIGKTLQLQLAADYLRDKGYTVHTTRASGGTPIGEKLRTVSLAPIERPPEVDVYISLAMHTALGQDLQQRKAAGEVCLVDRSPLAIIAYNIVASDLQDKRLGFEACKRMLKLWNIDELIVFTADEQTINQRRQSRAATDEAQGSNYFEDKDQVFHQAVQEGYRQGAQLVRNHPEWGIELIELDATPSVEDVHQAVMTHLL